MADGQFISKITLPSGYTYDIKDTWAREKIDALTSIDNGVSLIGVTETIITDGATTSSIQVDGKTYTPVKGDLIFAPTATGDTSTKEFLYDGEQWHLLDALNSYGTLATKNAVNVKYDKASVNTKTFTGTAVHLVTGNIPVPATYTSTFTGTQGNVSVSGTASGTVTTTTATTEDKTTTVKPASSSSGAVTYTPAGTIQNDKLSFTGTPATFNISGTASGNVTAASNSFTGTGVRLVTGNIPVPTSASFTGTAGTVNVTGTATGTVSKPTFTGTKVTGLLVSPATSGAATYTPQGTVSAPTISVTSGGNATTIKNPTAVSVVNALATAAPGATAPKNAITYYSVADETLSLYQIGATKTNSITTTDVTITASAPTFTGTGKRLVLEDYTPAGSISQPTFSNGEVSASGSFTPAGSVGLTNTNKTATVSATTGTATYTPAGTISNLGFSGGTISSTVNYTPEGTVTAASDAFAGTGVRLVTEAIKVPKTYTSTFTNGTSSGTGTFTPDGTVVTSTATTANKTATVIKEGSTGTTYTPEGTINVTLTQTNTNATVSYS